MHRIKWLFMKFLFSLNSYCMIQKFKMYSKDKMKLKKKHWLTSVQLFECIFRCFLSLDICNHWQIWNLRMRETNCHIDNSGFIITQILSSRIGNERSPAFLICNNGGNNSCYMIFLTIKWTPKCKVSITLTGYYLALSHACWVHYLLIIYGTVPAHEFSINPRGFSQSVGLLWLQRCTLMGSRSSLPLFSCSCNWEHGFGFLPEVSLKNVNLVTLEKEGEY